MKKIDWKRICYVASLILVLVFVIRVILDYINYDAMVNSAPFSVFILVEAINFIVPALLLFIAGLIIGKIKNKNNK